MGNKGDKLMLRVQFHSPFLNLSTILSSLKSLATLPKQLHYLKLTFLSKSISQCRICLYLRFFKKTAISLYRCGHIKDKHYSNTEHNQTPLGFMPLLQIYNNTILYTSSVTFQYYSLIFLANFSIYKPSIICIKC